jgi:hypothetical protein
MLCAVHHSGRTVRMMVGMDIRMDEKLAGRHATVSTTVRLAMLLRLYRRQRLCSASAV